MKGIIEKLMMEAYGVTNPGCIRTNNEDTFFIAAEDGLYVIADGMGGANAGEIASSLAVEAMRARLALTETQQQPPDLDTLVAAVHHANQTVREAAQANQTRSGMGTTLVALLEDLQDRQLLIASVGDSRAYLFTGGELKPITEDQSWVHEVGRKIGLDDETLRTHRMRNVLTMAIGVSAQLRVNTYTIPAEPGSEILLSTDGLHGVLTDEEIRDTLATPGSQEERCSKLIELTRDKGAPDNVTVILARVA